MDGFFHEVVANHQPHKPDYNAKEISLTAIEREAMLKGISYAFDYLLAELRLIKKPSKQVMEKIEKIENDMREIDKQYGKFKYQ